MTRRFGNDTTAVSTAVGAILLVTIMFMVVLVIQTSFVPRWQEEDEERHARVVQREFLEIVGHMEQRAENDSATPATFMVSMDRGGGSIFSLGADLPGEVLMTTFQDGSTYSASEMSVISRDGVSLAVLNETWISIGGTHEVDDLVSVSHLRLRVHNPASGDDGDSATIQITDASGEPAGNLTAYIDRYPSGYALKVLVQTPSGMTIVDDGESRFQQDAPDYMHVNAMEPSYFFTSLLANAEQPFSLDFIENSLTADFSIQGKTESGDPIGGGSPGALISDIERTLDGGRLELMVPNQQYPQQRFVMDHGAVVVEQSDGVAFLEPPAFEVGPLDDLTRVTIADTVAGGTPRGVSSHSPVRVTLGSGDTTSLVGTAPDLTWNVTTPWPTLWSDHWDDLLQLNGWDSGSGHYTITTGTDWARLELTGIGSSDHDLAVSWSHSTITTTLET